MQPSTTSRGFTLVSLAMTLGAIAMLMAFSLPQITAIHTTFALNAQQDKLAAWAQIARDSGLTLAKFEKCAEGEGCLYRKFGNKRECIGTGVGESKAGPGDHYYADGPCRYNLNKFNHRFKLQQQGYVLPALNTYLNGHNDRPIYLLHENHQVQAFTCMDQSYVANQNISNLADVSANPAYAVCSHNAHKVLFAALPDMHRGFQKALKRRLSIGSGDSFSDSGSGLGSGSDLP
ncbi:MAG: hypothetical protein CMH60_05020 [Myxococcales bacterium]|nr:hypothetical protein [Myxococcales bacterium]